MLGDQLQARITELEQTSRLPAILFSASYLRRPEIQVSQRWQLN